eukprot:3440299-Prymnesium_polylepis.1
MVAGLGSSLARSKSARPLCQPLQSFSPIVRACAMPAPLPPLRASPPRGPDRSTPMCPHTAARRRSGVPHLSAPAAPAQHSAMPSSKSTQPNAI